jgi:hypothetical protein
MLPWCAKCNKAVRSVTRRIDFWTGNLMYIVECHGHTQIQFMPAPHDAQELTVF